MKPGAKPTIIEERPNPGPQTAFLSSQAFEVGYGGALAGGKSWAIQRAALRFMSNGNARSIILRRTFPELRDLIDKSHLIMPHLGLRWRESEKRWVHQNGFTLEYGYCENFRDVGQYVGQEFTFIGVDQLEQWPEERMWTTLLSRLRTKDASIVKMARATFNPGGQGHGWVKRRFIQTCPPDGTPVWIVQYEKDGKTPRRNPQTGEVIQYSRAFFQASIYDNPVVLEADPGYLNYLESLPETMRRQMLLGEWDAGEGIAFPNLTERSHLATTPLPSNIQYYGAFDWGYGHKWVFGLFAVLPEGRIRVVETVSGRRHTPDQIAERVREMLAMQGLGFGHLQFTVSGSDVKMRDGARGAFGPSVAEQFQDHGWMLMNADNSRVAGYQNLLVYLERKRLEFADTPNNRTGLSQMMEMATDPDFPNDVLKVDVDPDTGEGGDDWYDMLRYGLMARPIFRAVKRAESRVDPEWGKAWGKELKGWEPGRVPAPGGLPGKRARSVSVT